MFTSICSAMYLRLIQVRKISFEKSLIIIINVKNNLKTYLNYLGSAKTNGKKTSKISESNKSHASIFLRIGGIVFGLGVMIYNGLEFGAYFEIPHSSPCYSILLGSF